MSHHRVETNNLKFLYPDGFEAIKDITFSLHHGESVGVIGANGAGKSTLLMLLMGILIPNEGEITIGDVKLTKKTTPMIRERMGMVFQNPNDQLFMTTVYDDVAFGPRNYKLNENEVDMRVEAALKTVGISHLKDRAPFKLSGGEKKAAAIATVLSLEPDILIMDEPTSGLDPKARRRVIELLKTFEHTKIITSHDLDMIYEICDRIILLKDGMVIKDGKKEDILQDENLLSECNLELPPSMGNCLKCGTAKE
jgi:cobalt/nickel transport system ATP-binding protein